MKNTVSTRQEECRHLGEEVAEYIEERETQADYLFTQLYRGTHELSDLLAFLTMEPDAYRAYVLDYFSESNGRSYNGIEKFVSNAFEAYPELEQVELLSYSTKKQFLFLSQEVVYPYRDGEARLREIRKEPGKERGRADLYQRDHKSEYDETGGLYDLYILCETASSENFRKQILGRSAGDGRGWRDGI